MVSILELPGIPFVGGEGPVDSSSVNTVIVGLGKIGLPLAVQAASKGHSVVGVDVNETTVDLINGGHEPFPGEAGLADGLKAAIRDGLLSATIDMSVALADASTVIIVVPLIVDDDALPDFTALDAATAAVGRALQAGTLVSYETTLPVGTTRNRFVPALEKASGLRCGEDLFVVFSPERVYSGRIFADLKRYPKLVGGVDEPSTARAIDFYESLLDFDERPDLDRPNGVWDLGSSEASEFAKLAETTYRDVNIGLANEFARFADTVGVDVARVIEASNSQPFSHIHQPGVAVGGHCIPVYPRFYLKNDPSALVPSAARDANEAMPAYAVGRLENHFGSLRGKRVAILGACYRGGVKETAFSGVFPLASSLSDRDATVVVHDPLFLDDELRILGFEPYHLGEECDAVIIQADHAEYRHLTSTDVPGATAILDGRRCLESSDMLTADGVSVLRLGG